MLLIKKGNYKNLSITVNYNGDVIIKAPSFFKSQDIKTFYLSKKTWIDRNLNLINIQNELKNTYNFNKFIYLYNTIYKEITSKKDSYKIYLDNFNNEIVSKVKQISDLLGFNMPQIVEPIKSKRIWGSLSNKNEMKLNILISILPKKQIEYIIIHELCHSIEFNHSKKFWSNVSKFLPEYKNIKKELLKYSFILRADIL